MYYAHSLHERYGPYVLIAPNEVSTSSPVAFSQIHKIGAGSFTKSNWYADLVGFERPTLFTMVDSRAHAVRRKLLARAFSKTYLRQHWEGVVREKIRMAVERMKGESEMEGSTDVLKWWTLMATDVATHLMFGDSFHMIEEGNVGRSPSMLIMFRLEADCSKKTEYIQKLEAALQGGGIGAELPLVRAIGKRLPFQPFINLFQANTYITSRAEIAVTNAKAGGEKSLFAHIIAEAEKGEQLDDIDVKLEAGALIVAGSDTTAVTTTYLVWALLSRPDIKACLEQELSTLPTKYGDRDLEELPLLNAVIEETLRLYGAAPGGIPRAVPAGGTHLEGHFLPGGTTVTTQAYTLHRDPEVFPHPLK